MENKKINSKIILIAMTMLFMFSYLKAQEDIKIDFDGGNLKTMDISKVIKSDVNNAGNMKIPSSGLETEISDKIGKQEFDKNLDDKKSCFLSL